MELFSRYPSFCLWNVSPRSIRTHALCVCVIHRNVYTQCVTEKTTHNTRRDTHRIYFERKKNKKRKRNGGSTHTTIIREKPLSETHIWKNKYMPFQAGYCSRAEKETETGRKTQVAEVSTRTHCQQHRATAAKDQQKKYGFVRRHRAFPAFNNHRRRYAAFARFLSNQCRAACNLASLVYRVCMLGCCVLISSALAFLFHQMKW